MLQALVRVRYGTLNRHMIEEELFCFCYFPDAQF